ncbi:resolvase [Bacillus sp. AFS026049]|nr:resolvase [Bacillus sp. AFS026049]
MNNQDYVEDRHIALYCRVSTDEQAREGISLNEQQERMKAYCRAMGWGDNFLLFIDDGYSAKNLDRPKLTKLLDEVEKGTISKVLITKLDRLSRKLKDLLNLIDIFNDHKVSFISIGESFDTNTSPGRLTLQVLGAVAEFERERIRERVVENMQHAAKNGKWLTQSPYGYDLLDKELVINEKESQIVKEVFDLYLQKGLGFYSIAKKLNERGIPSRQKKEWSIRSIKLMLTNPVYKGTLVWNRIDRSKQKQVEKDDEEWIVVHHSQPQIIDVDTWELVQRTVNKKKIPSRAKTSPHLLGGLLKCGRCGASMSISWTGTAPNRKRVYRCSANKNKGICTSKPYKANDVESWFKHGLLQLSQSINESYVLLLADQFLGEEKKDMTQQVQSAKNRYKRKVEAYTAGLIELEDLQTEKLRMETLIQQSKNRQETISVNIEELERKVNDKFQTVIDALDTLPIVEAKALIQTLVEKVVVFKEREIEIVLSIPT